jgi:ureidoglycolate amidohydrolase
MCSVNLSPPDLVHQQSVPLQGLQLGVVTAIAAPAALRITFIGGGGHAGALLMHRRADAALAAAELALHVEKATLAHGAHPLK